MRSVPSRRWWAVAAAGLMAVTAGGLWWQRTPVLAWYYVRTLARADEAERERWVQRVAALDEAAVPRLLGCLGEDDRRACENAELALVAITSAWQGDERVEELAGRLADEFPRLPEPGQRAVLSLHAGWMRPAQDGAGPHAGLLDTARRLLTQAARSRDAAVRALVLELAGLTPLDPEQGELVTIYRDLARSHLRDPNPDHRIRAARLAQQPATGLHTEVVPLLEDPVPEVRRAAMLAVGHVPGPQAEVVGTEDLFRWLHDGDADVRRICEAALRVRGLGEEHLRLAKLVTDRRPAVRAQVVTQLRYVPEQEPWYWLRRLSYDPCPEVRVAAIRAASEQTLVDLRERIDQMSRTDPSPTVSRLARYYLSRSERRENGPTTPPRE